MTHLISPFWTSRVYAINQNEGIAVFFNFRVYYGPHKKWHFGVQRQLRQSLESGRHFVKRQRYFSSSSSHASEFSRNNKTSCQMNEVFLLKPYEYDSGKRRPYEEWGVDECPINNDISEISVGPAWWSFELIKLIMARATF
jgi:hypothetical protein